MPMLQSTSHSAIRFNSDFFDQSDIDRLLKLRTPAPPALTAEVHSLPPMFELPAFKAGDRHALFNAEASRDALSQSLDILMEDPEYRSAIGDGDKDTLMQDAGDNLTAQLKGGLVSDAVADNNRAARESVQLVAGPDGHLSFEVAGTQLLSFNPSLLRGVSLELIVQVASVILDIFALLCTALDIAIAHGSDWVKRIAKFIQGFGQDMVDWGGNMLKKAGTWIFELRSAHGGPAWMTKVTNFAKQIGTFVMEALKLGWPNRNFINTIRYSFTCLFSGSYLKRAYYLLQLIAAVILFVGTAGASLMVMVVLALIQLALFIWDSIVLYQMLHPEPARATG